MFPLGLHSSLAGKRYVSLLQSIFRVNLAQHGIFKPQMNLCMSHWFGGGGAVGRSQQSDTKFVMEGLKRVPFQRVTFSPISLATLSPLITTLLSGRLINIEVFQTPCVPSAFSTRIRLKKIKKKQVGKKKEPEVRCLKRCTGVAAFLRNLPH